MKDRAMGPRRVINGYGGKYPEMSYEVMARIEGDRILEVILWN